MGPVFGVESPTYVAVRALLSVCSTMLVGTMVVRWAVLVRYAGPGAPTLRRAIDERLPHWIDVLGGVALAMIVGRLLAQHAAVFGVGAEYTSESLGTLMLRSRWGRSWWLAALSALMITWCAPRLRPRFSVWWIVVSAATLVLAASQPWSGHAAVSPQPWRAVLTQVIHVVGAGGWIGSLAMITMLVIPLARRLPDATNDDADARIASVVRAFSPVALICAALVVLSGVLTAWANLGGLPPLWRSPYGSMLLTKLTLLSIAVGVGAFNWRCVLPSLGTPQASARLQRSSAIELGAAFLVLVVTAVLVATPLPGK